jgi:hypothetical protein
MKELVAARDADGPFASLAEFAARVDPKLLNKMQVENLAKAGAFDALEGNRARLVAGAETVLRRAQASAEDRSSNQIGLFGEVEQGPPLLRLPEIPTGRRSTSWPSRRRRWASTSRPIHWTSTRVRCGGLASRPPRSSATGRGRAPGGSSWPAR